MKVEVGKFRRRKRAIKSGQDGYRRGITKDKIYGHICIKNYKDVNYFIE